MKRLLNYKKAVIGALVVAIIASVGVKSIVASAEVLTEPELNLSLSFSQGSAGIGENVKVTGTIKPQPFDIVDKEQEIVLVLATSGSMDNDVAIKCNEQRYDKYCVKHNKRGEHSYSIGTRLSQLKDAAESFIEKMSAVPNTKISIISYSDKAEILTSSSDSKFINASEVSELKEIINNLKTGKNNGNNTGEALRKAAYVLSGDSKKTGQNPFAEKTIVFMTDGYPTFYTGDTESQYYNDITTEKNSSNINRDENKAQEYAECIGNIIKEKNYNVYTVGYELSTTTKKRVNKIHDSMSEVTANNFSSDDMTIQEKFNSVAEGIKGKIESNKAETLTVSNIVFDTGLGEFAGSLTSNLNEDNIIAIDDITYRRLDNSNTYTAEDVTFSFEIIGEKAGSYSLFKNTSIEYSFNGIKKTTSIDSRKIVITENVISKDIPITIQVSDSGGNISDKYDTGDQDKSWLTYNKQVINDATGQEYRLFGSSKADIKLDSTKEDIDFLQYQFIKTSAHNSRAADDINSIEIDETKWQDIDLTMDTINEDVDIENQGNLTQREYNVTNLPSLSGNAVWSDRSKVFGTPLDGIYTKSTTVAQTPEEYGEWIEYTVNGQKKLRWRTKTLFMVNMKINPKRDENGEENQYKEASKFWGYYSPEETGWYNFGLRSDDGSAGWITVGGEVIEFSNSFKPQSSSFNTKNRMVYLEKGKYYPLYLEYFNWGGGAEFRMQYKFASGAPDRVPSKGWSSWGDINGSTLYPSKSTEPGESATNLFTGSKGVSFPDEAGRYYIAYQCGNEEGILKQGLYGPFNIDEKLSIERTLSKEEVQVNEAVELTYTIKPADIDVNDIYKGGTENPQSHIYIKNIKITDKIGSGLNITNLTSNTASLAQNINSATKENTIQIELKNPIVFNLSSDKKTYTAQDVTVTLSLSSQIPGEYSLNSSNCFYNYNDLVFNKDETSSVHLQGRAKKDLEIVVLGGSKILNHGIYLGHNDNLLKESQDSPIHIASTMDLNIGAVVEVKHKGTSVRLTTDVGSIDTSSIKIYELGSDNSLIKSSGTVYLIKDGIISFKQEDAVNKRYIIVYNYIPNGNTYNKINLTAEIVGYNSSKTLRLIIGEGGLPDLF